MKKIHISPFMIEYARKRNKKIVIKDGEIFFEDIKTKDIGTIVCWTILSIGSLGLLLQLLR